MKTSWPQGSACPRPRRRRSRPPSRVVREDRKVSRTSSQVMHKLIAGRTFDPTVPLSADAAEVRNLECCNTCGGPLRGAFAGEPRDGACAKCNATKTPRQIAHTAQIVGVDKRGIVLGTHVVKVSPAQGDPHIDAGDALRRIVDGRATRHVDAAIAKARGKIYAF